MNLARLARWHGRPAHVLTGETPVLRDGYGSITILQLPLAFHQQSLGFGRNLMIRCNLLRIDVCLLVGKTQLGVTANGDCEQHTL